MDLSLAPTSNMARMNTRLLISGSHYKTINTIKCKASLVSKGKGTNFYNVLSLDSDNVAADTIKRAYRSMALRYHPDVCPPSKREESTRMFIELQKAYETLSDPVSREKYDHHLALVESLEEEELEEFQGISRYPKEAWMNQLNELQVRSSKRMAKKNQGNF